MNHYVSSVYLIALAELGVARVRWSVRGDTGHQDRHVQITASLDVEAEPALLVGPHADGHQSLLRLQADRTTNIASKSTLTSIILRNFTIMVRLKLLYMAWLNFY